MKTIERNSLSNAIVKEIVKAIKEGVYQPGDKIPTIQQLSQELKVGLSSVREGLQKLQSIGVIEIQHGRGTFVRETIDIGTMSSNLEHLLILKKPYISHLIEARRLIECETAKLATERATPEQIGKLYQIIQNMKSNLNNLKEFAIEDLNFHFLIAECSKNPVLGIFLKSIQGLLIEEIEAVLKLPGAFERAVNYHTEIYEVIKNRDPDEAVKRMASHLLDIGRAIDKEVKGTK